jgi:thioredoxin 1
MKTNQNILEQIEANPRPLVVDVWAPWCGPCRAMGPVLEKLAVEYEGRVDVLKVNADEHPALVQKWNVRGIPTLLLFKDGQEKGRLLGMQPRPAMTEFFEFGLTGQGKLKIPLAPVERILRLAAGLTLAAVGLFAVNSWWMAAAGFVLMFLAVHDRCPLWQFVTSKLAGQQNKQ